MGLTHSRMPLSRRAWRLVVVGSALSGVALALPAPATAASAAVATTTRVSVSGTGAQATNLVRGDTNGNTDVFVHDVRNGVTRRISVSANGAQGNGASYNAVISSDGRHVAFESDATNLVPGDSNGHIDIFVRVI